MLSVPGTYFWILALMVKQQRADFFASDWTFIMAK
jgi:hypothetical protein